jgi:hypothetical protein
MNAMGRSLLNSRAVAYRRIGSRIALDSEQERRKVYPLKLEIEDPRGWSSAQLSYQVDDQPQQFGEPYMPGSPYYQVKLPLIIEAKNHIVVRLDSKLSYEAYSKGLIYNLNGVQVKPQWHTGKNSVTHRYEAVATFELP